MGKAWTRVLPVQMDRKSPLKDAMKKKDSKISIKDDTHQGHRPELQAE